MPKRPEIVLALPPEYVESAGKYHTQKAYMAYRIGSGFHLYRASDMPLSVKGGIMVVDKGESCGRGSGDSLSGEIVRECINRRFGGIVLDLDPPLDRQLEALAERIDYAAPRNDIALFVPEKLGRTFQNAFVLISTSVATGSLSAKLERAASIFGLARLSLEIETSMNDYVIPARAGGGRRLSEDEFVSLFRSAGGRRYFSRDLCTCYFTYRNGGKTHLVLYDDADSIRQKLLLAERFGFASAFIFYPHIEKFAAKLFE